MAISEADVQASLRALIDPNTGRDFVSDKAIRKVQIDGGNVAVDVVLGYPAKSQHETLRRLIQRQLSALPGVGKVNAVHWKMAGMARCTQRQAMPDGGGLVG